MNFLGGGVADYVDTGSWSKKAHVAAGFYGKPRYAATGKDGERYVRAPQELDLSADAKYVHLTSNATIAGVQYHSFPEVSAPLVADMSSDMLWRPIDVSKFSLIYAGAQKNLGPAGVALAIIEKSFMAKGNQELPEMLRYDFIASKGSTHNTPPVFAIYAVGKVLAWVKAQGGAAAMEKRNRAKAEMLYGTIDGNAEFFRCPIEKASRSVMNVVFNLPTPELEKAFLDEGKKNGLVNMKGHRSVGGIRISMYNAMDPENIQTLTAFMKDFAAKNG
jgi:phosphoserine aminotransferase